jgi:hypothetical protein
MLQTSYSYTAPDIDAVTVAQGDFVDVVHALERVVWVQG